MESPQPVIHGGDLADARMRAWVLTRHGGLDALELRDVAIPQPGRGEVLIEVAAAGLNNVDVNTRVGWYSKDVTSATGGAGDIGASEVRTDSRSADGGWAGEAVSFPRIQGADCCGHIVAVGPDVSPERVGARVVVRALQSHGARAKAKRTGTTLDPLSTWTLGSECDGAFAEYVVTYDNDALTVTSELSNRELACLPCAYSTAEAMIQRARLACQPAERILVTGASGGVGAAAVQLLIRRGANVTAVVAGDKAEALLAIGAADTLERHDVFPRNSFDAVVDVVAGERWPDLLEALRRGGRYVTAGAIAGPVVTLDMRALYLRDLTLFGSTYQPDSILKDVVGYVEAGELVPLVASSFRFEDLIEAQRAFMAKRHVGKIVVALDVER